MLVLVSVVADDTQDEWEGEGRGIAKASSMGTPRGGSILH